MLPNPHTWSLKQNHGRNFAKNKTKQLIKYHNLFTFFLTFLYKFNYTPYNFSQNPTFFKPCNNITLLTTSFNIKFIDYTSLQHTTKPEKREVPQNPIFSSSLYKLSPFLILKKMTQKCRLNFNISNQPFFKKGVAWKLNDNMLSRFWIPVSNKFNLFRYHILQKQSG